MRRLDRVFALPYIKIWLPLLLLAGLIWALPLRARVVLLPGAVQPAMVWPRIELDPPIPQPGQPLQITIQDAAALPNVQLTIDGRAKHPSKWEITEVDEAPWEWTWQIEAPSSLAYDLILYHHCDTGCIERTRWTVGKQEEPQTASTPTKLGVVFANLERDWHGKRAWEVELTYARLADVDHWGIDDLAQRVGRATAAGLQVIVRVDYDQGQSLPPPDEQAALIEYLDYVRRLARDQRLRDVYALQIGSGYNSAGANSQADGNLVTPEWYARVFNGYGENAARTDNIIQIVRPENPNLRVLVGPVQPWNQDQNGAKPHQIDVPWLNYFNTLVAHLDASAKRKAAAGFPLTGPDGFAVQTPGRPDAPELQPEQRALEPLLDLPRAEWGGAQAGFRVYRDWLAVINAHETTRGRPMFITSTNTFTPDHPALPAQNYPHGWLNAALQEVNGEPQVAALCWFLDFDSSGDHRWDGFSLSTQTGELIEAEREFDALLAERP